MNSLKTLTDIIDRHAAKDGSHSCALPGITLIRASSPTLPMPVIYHPTLCLVAQGTKEARLGEATYRYDPANYLIASVELPVMGSVIEASEAKPYLCLQLDFDMTELTEMVIRCPHSPAQTTDVSAGLLLNKTTPALLDAAVRYASLLDTPQDIAIMAPLILREMLYRLLTEPSGNLLRHMAHADSRLNQIARAIIWLRRHFREPCRIEQAADIAGMSRSAFHHHFRAITTMSPIAFRTHLRIQEARRLMVSDALDAATAGFQVGYESPSQFSRDYARLFGMPPARHAAQLRQHAVGALR